MKYILLLSVSLCLCGCASTGRALKDIIGAMGNDNAAVTVSVNTIYGTGRLTRVMPSSNTVINIAPDGTVTVKSNQ